MSRTEPELTSGSAGNLPAGADETLWREFAEAVTPETFYGAWLALQCRMIPGVGSGVVVAGHDGAGPFAPAAFWPPGRREARHLTEVAERALAERHGLVIRREVRDDARETGRERYDVAYPIQARGKVYGVVALDIAPRPDAELGAVLRDLQWGSAWLEVLVHRLHASRQDPASAGAVTERLRAILDLLAGTLGQGGFSGTAMAFATAVATRLDCDRVSLGFLRRGRVHVRTVSHSAQFRRQTNLIRAVAAAMEEAVDQQATVVHPAAPAGARRVARAHEELARLEGAGAICTVPLADGRKVVGALTLERPADRPFDGPTVEFLEALAAVVGPVLEVQRRDDRWLLAKAADASWRQVTHLIGRGHVALKLGVAAGVAAVAFLAFAHGDYRVSSKMVMEPEVRRAAVAPFSGYIKEAPVRAGDLVRQGQLLALLEDRELRLERLRWWSQQEQLLKQRDLALATRNAAQVAIATAQIDQARAQLALLDDQLARTRVVAGFDGVVVSGDLSQSLGAPVERGQVLFEVAPLDAYRVVLQVDERDIADAAVGQRGELLLAAAPTDAIPFTVGKITPVATAREGRNYFRVEANLDRTPERLRPGMEGVGKIVVDRRLLVWIWTRQAIDWLRLTLWKWLP